MTEEKVRMLRLEYSTGCFSQEELAKKYGIAQGIASVIIRRKAWRHVI